MALAFKTVEEEAEYIARTAASLRGTLIHEDSGERGISWSDIAILLRSVKANGEAITDALDGAGIPYVVAGMTNLFSTTEAEAARQLFYFMAARPGWDEDTVTRPGKTPMSASRKCGCDKLSRVRRARAPR